MESQNIIITKEMLANNNERFVNHPIDEAIHMELYMVSSVTTFT